MLVKYIYLKSNNLTPGNIYEVVGENEKTDCYIIKSTDKKKVGTFKKYKFKIIKE